MEKLLNRAFAILVLTPALVFAGSDVSKPSPALYANTPRVDLASTASGKDVALTGFVASGISAVVHTGLDKGREFLSVKDYGAIGDGVHDDTAAIQAAISACSAGGCILHIPHGIYLVSGVITVNGINDLTISGDGATWGLSSGSSMIKCADGFSGSMLFALTSVPGFHAENLYLYANSANIAAFKLNGAGRQNRFIGFKRVAVEGFNQGFWFGDYTNQGPKVVTYVFSVELDEVFIRNCVYPIIADAGGFDALTIKNSWIADPFNRTIRGVQVLTSGTNLYAENFYMDLGTSTTYGFYGAVPFGAKITSSRIESQIAGTTYVGFYQPVGSADNPVIFENFSIQHTAVSPTVADVGNTKGFFIRGGVYQGNINISSASVPVYPANPTFSSRSFGFTGSTALLRSTSQAFTPVLNFGGGSTGITYSARNAYYILDGNTCTIQGSFTLSSKGSSTGSAQITGLPLSLKNKTGGDAVVSVFVALGAPTNGVVQGLAPANSTIINLYTYNPATGNVALINDKNFSNSSVVEFTATYEF